MYFISWFALKFIDMKQFILYVFLMQINYTFCNKEFCSVVSYNNRMKNRQIEG